MPLERRGSFEEREFAQSGSSGKVVQENVVTKDDAQDSEGVAEKSPSMRLANFAPRREGDAGQVPGSENSIRNKKVEDSPQRVSEATEADSETQKTHATLKPIQDNVASLSTQCAPLSRLSPNWWPCGLRSAAAAVEPCSAKWNFRMGQNAGAGALAGGVVSLCLHPIDTLKTIVQSQTGGSRNLLPILSSVISERGTQFLLLRYFSETSVVCAAGSMVGRLLQIPDSYRNKGISLAGLKGLYRGLGSNLASSAPTSAIYTLTYEAVKAGLLRHIPEV